MLYIDKIQNRINAHARIQYYMKNCFTLCSKRFKGIAKNVIYHSSTNFMHFSSILAISINYVNFFEHIGFCVDATKRLKK